MPYEWALNHNLLKWIFLSETHNDKIYLTHQATLSRGYSTQLNSIENNFTQDFGKQCTKSCETHCNQFLFKVHTCSCSTLCCHCWQFVWEPYMLEPIIFKAPFHLLQSQWTTDHNPSNKILRPMLKMPIRMQKLKRLGEIFRVNKVCLYYQF
jgi:hypothetical protein